MSAVLTGTPVEITWGSGTDPSPQDITVPADCTAVYMFWSYYFGSTGDGLASVTLEGVSPDETHEITTVSSLYSATGVAVWYNPTTGANQTVDVSWDGSPGEGPITVIVFVKDGDTTGWRDVDSEQGAGTDPVSVTLTTVSGDLVLKLDQKYESGTTPPSLSSGWTNGLTGDNNFEHFRFSYIEAGGSSQVCDSEDDYYSTVVAVAIPAASGSTINTKTTTDAAAVTDAAQMLRQRIRESAESLAVSDSIVVTYMPSTYIQYVQRTTKIMRS